MTKQPRKKSRAPHRHGHKNSLIIMRHLPPGYVPRPLRKYMRASCEFWERTVGIIIIFLLLCWLLYVVASTYTGNATRTTVNITQRITNNCTFPLEPGLNYVSFNCITTSQDTNAVFANTDLGQIVAVYGYTPLDNDKWKVFAPNLPNWTVNDADTLSRLAGYIIWVNTSGNGTDVDYEGYTPLSSTVPAYFGYNLLGYPSLINDSTMPALTTINDTFRHIWTRNSSGTFTYRLGVGGTLPVLRPYQGYWVNMTITDAWIVSYNRSAP